jgi:iron-sulfur cluster repair protein YtfE (RIC family)
MDFELQISRRLHREHLAAIGLVRRLGTYLRDNPADRPPGPTPAAVSFLNELSGALEGEIGPHFGFEDDHLFPRLDDLGDSDLVGLLRDEHDLIRPLTGEFTSLARDAAANGWTDQLWSRFHELGRELSERLVSHIQKETMALLPMVEDVIDADTDRALAAAYAGD